MLAAAGGNITAFSSEEFTLLCNSIVSPNGKLTSSGAFTGGWDIHVNASLSKSNGSLLIGVSTASEWLIIHLIG